MCMCVCFFFALAGLRVSKRFRREVAAAKRLAVDQQQAAAIRVPTEVSHMKPIV